MKRELFSERTIFVDTLDDREGDMQRIDTVKSVYVESLDVEEKLEVKETIEIAVVAEVNEGIANYYHVKADLPTITEDEGDSSFTGISPKEFVPPTNTARKFILLTFIILLTSTKIPMTIDSRW
jgi:hypothetical protein